LSVHLEGEVYLDVEDTAGRIDGGEVYLDEGETVKVAAHQGGLTRRWWIGREHRTVRTMRWRRLPEGEVHLE
jgi:hypothetical protein